MSKCMFCGANQRTHPHHTLGEMWMCGTMTYGGEIIQKCAFVYLQNVTAGYVGDCVLWWRQGGSGYTTNLEDAEKLTWHKADKIIAGSRGTHEWKKYLCEEVDKITVRTVDSQDLAQVHEIGKT